MSFVIFIKKSAVIKREAGNYVSDITETQLIFLSNFSSKKMKPTKKIVKNTKTKTDDKKEDAKKSYSIKDEKY